MKSYQLENLPNDIFALELERLKSQAVMFWGKEAALLARLGLVDTKTAVDLGCGPGFVTQLLAETYPNLSITGIDTSAQLLSVAQETLVSEKIKFLEGSVYATGLQDNSQDFVYSRLVFQHLSSPEKAAIEAFRICKPGGQIAILDIDASLQKFSQELPSTGKLLKLITQIQEQNGGNREVGLKLPGILSQAGFISIKFAMDSITTLEMPFEKFCELTVGYAQWLCKTESERMLFSQSALELQQAAKTALGMIPVIFVSGTKPEN